MALTPEEKRQRKAARMMDTFKRKGKTAAIEMTAKTLQELRRLQEADDNGYVQCVSCAVTRKWNNAMEGGHYVSRTSLATKLNPLNVWPQCTRCNHYLSGNLANYREYLDHRIGEEKRQELEASKGTRQYELADLVELRIDFMDRIKSEKKRLGIE